MDFGEAVQVLRRVPIFAKVEPAKLKLLAFASEYQVFEGGETLFREGDPADCAYLVDEGEVAICIGEGNDEFMIGTLGRHELFGEMALFRNAPRVATIRAKGQAKVMRIDGEMFIRMVTENPGTALEVMRSLSDKIARTTESMEEMGETVRRLQSVSDKVSPCAPAPVPGTTGWEGR